MTNIWFVKKVLGLLSKIMQKCGICSKKYIVSIFLKENMKTLILAKRLKKKKKKSLTIVVLYVILNSLPTWTTYSTFENFSWSPTLFYNLILAHKGTAEIFYRVHHHHQPLIRCSKVFPQQWQAKWACGEWHVILILSSFHRT